MEGLPHRIALAGSTGRIGGALIRSAPGIEWVSLSRQVLWGPAEELAAQLKGAGAIVNLAGSSIAGIWTRRNRQRIIESREELNHRLVKVVQDMESPPEIFLTASAIGYYSNEGVHSESQFQAGEGFLAEVVRRWEDPLEQLPDNVLGIKARIANVLGREGGMLAPFLMASRTGMIPVMGSGKQPVSFIHMEDLVRGLIWILRMKQGGVYNMAAPHPTDFATFARTLVRNTRAMTTFRIPRFLLQLVMGDSHVLVTQGQHVVPERLMKEGFEFNHPRLDDALENLLKKH